MCPPNRGRGRSRGGGCHDPTWHEPSPVRGGCQGLDEGDWCFHRARNRAARFDFQGRVVGSRRFLRWGVHVRGGNPSTVPAIGNLNAGRATRLDPTTRPAFWRCTRNGAPGETSSRSPRRPDQRCVDPFAGSGGVQIGRRVRLRKLCFQGQRRVGFGPNRRRRGHGFGPQRVQLIARNRHRPSEAVDDIAITTIRKGVECAIIHHWHGVSVLARTPLRKRVRSRSRRVRGPTPIAPPLRPLLAGAGRRDRRGTGPVAAARLGRHAGCAPGLESPTRKRRRPRSG